MPAIKPSHRYRCCCYRCHCRCQRPLPQPPCWAGLTGPGHRESGHRESGGPAGWQVGKCQVGNLTRIGVGRLKLELRDVQDGRSYTAGQRLPTDATPPLYPHPPSHPHSHPHSHSPPLTLTLPHRVPLHDTRSWRSDGRRRKLALSPPAPTPPTPQTVHFKHPFSAAQTRKPPTPTPRVRDYTPLPLTGPTPTWESRRCCGR